MQRFDDLPKTKILLTTPVRIFPLPPGNIWLCFIEARLKAFETSTAIDASRQQHGSFGYWPVYRLVCENYLARKWLGFYVAFVRVLAGFEVQVFVKRSRLPFPNLEVEH